MAVRARLASRAARREPTFVGPEYDLVNFADDAGYALRDEGGDVRVVESSGDLEWVEIQCERCGRFGRDVAPAPSGRWTCYANDSAGACAEAAGRGAK